MLLEICEINFAKIVPGQDAASCFVYTPPNTYKQYQSKPKACQDQSLVFLFDTCRNDAVQCFKFLFAIEKIENKLIIGNVEYT